MEGLVEGRQGQGESCSFVGWPVWDAEAYGKWCRDPPATPQRPPATTPPPPATAPCLAATPPCPPATPPRPPATPPGPPATPLGPPRSTDQSGQSAETAIEIEDDDEEEINLKIKQDEVQAQGKDRSSGPLRIPQPTHRHSPYQRPAAVSTTARGSGSKIQSFANNIITAADGIDNQLLNNSLRKIAESLRHIIAGTEAESLPGKIDALMAILSLNAGLRCILDDTLSEMTLYAQSLSSMKDEPQ